MKKLAAALLLATALAAQQASLEGVVLHSVTRQPIPGVHIRVVQMLQGSDVRAVNYGAISDSGGHFSITALTAGTYAVLPDRTGFVSVPQRPESLDTVALKPGERKGDYTVLMAPVSVLTGRALDENGDPMQNILVTATPSDGITRFLMRSNASVTDDRGIYRLVLTPAKYILQASPPNVGMVIRNRPEIRSDGTSEAIYGATYFPNESSKERAVELEAKPGAEMSGLDFRLTRRQLLSISGTVRGIPPGVPGRTYVSLESGGRMSSSDAADADGKFSIGRMEPGAYRISARYSGTAELFSVPLDVRADSDVTGINLILLPGADISGSLTVAAAPGQPKSSAPMSITLVSESFTYATSSRSFSGDRNPDGSFEISAVPPARYRIRVEPLPENGYIKTVEQDNFLLKDDRLDLSRGLRSARLRIIVGTDAAQITGKVLDSEGNALSGQVCGVFLMTDDQDVRDRAPATSDSAGAYSLKSIRPGKYRIFAIEAKQLPSFAESYDAGLSKLFKVAPEIEIKGGDRLTRDVKLFSKEVLDALRK